VLRSTLLTAIASLSKLPKTLTTPHPLPTQHNPSHASPAIVAGLSSPTNAPTQRKTALHSHPTALTAASGCKPCPPRATYRGPGGRLAALCVSTGSAVRARRASSSAWASRAPGMAGRWRNAALFCCCLSRLHDAHVNTRLPRPALGAQPSHTTPEHTHYAVHT
jgi:hypothetical protein